jgi:hypothetical protein
MPCQIKPANPFRYVRSLRLRFCWQGRGKAHWKEKATQHLTIPLFLIWSQGSKPAVEAGLGALSELRKKQPGEGAGMFRNAVFPIYGREIKKFLSMGMIKFLIVFVLTITRDIKDSLIVTHCGERPVYIVPKCECVGFLCLSADC